MKWWMSPLGAVIAATLFVTMTSMHPLLAGVLAGVLTGLAFRWGARREEPTDAGS